MTGIMNGTSSASPIITPKSVDVLNVVPQTELLDTSANKTKAQLASSGMLAGRRPPSTIRTLAAVSFIIALSLSLSLSLSVCVCAQN